MKYLFIIILILLTACSSQPRKIKVISNYQYGFSISETPEMVNRLIKIGDICIKLNPKINQIQSLVRKGGNWFAHEFNINAVVDWINQLNNCSNNDQTIIIHQLISEIDYFARKRYDGYNIYIKFDSSYQCNYTKHTFSSGATFGIENNSFIGQKKEDAIIASAVLMTVYQAVSKIYDEMVLDCH